MSHLISYAVLPSCLQTPSHYTLNLVLPVPPTECLKQLMGGVVKIEFPYPHLGLKTSTCPGPVLPSATAPAGNGMPLQVLCTGLVCPTSASQGLEANPHGCRNAFYIGICKLRTPRLVPGIESQKLCLPETSLQLWWSRVTDGELGLRMETIKEECLKTGRGGVEALGPLSGFLDVSVCSFIYKNKGKFPNSLPSGSAMLCSSG